MSPAIGEQIVAWTARAAVACYVARVAIDASFAAGPRKDRFVRVAWTAGCVAFLLHVAAAFHFVHAWSHRDAWMHTARRTAAVTGLDWGGGLWFNDAFAAAWVVDALRMWLVDRPEQPGWWFWTVHAFFAFMMVNATIVFGPTTWRWLGPVVIVGLFGLWWQLRRCPGRGRL